jgi:hypothetical protein
MQKVKVNVRKWKWEAVSNLLPCCCHAKSEREKVKVRSICQAVDMLLACKKWKQTWESESEKVLLLCSYHAEKQFPTCCHAVAMQIVKVNVRKWKWERAVAMQLTCRWIFCVVFVVNESCPHVFAAQETELRLYNSWSSTFGPDYFLKDCQSMFW